jgi:hypothetical protein
MDQVRRGVLYPSRKTRWLVWLVYCTCWTTALIMPVPSHGSWHIRGFGDIDMRFVFAKAVHVSAYAIFAVLTGWLRVSLPTRLVLLFVLMAHTALTEVIQDQVGRSGSEYDVALDQIGIGLGLILSWRWWRDPG